MRNIKLFLASGNNLKKDRDEIMLFLASKNQFLVKHGIFLELIRWEFLSSTISKTRKQSDFNKEVEDSDIFTCLIFDKIGQYTKEEFNIAYQNYKQGKNPKKFYLYFKALPKNKKKGSIEVYEFKKTIEKEEQIYREYDNPDQLKVFLNQNLDNDLPDMLKEALIHNLYEPESDRMTQNVPEELLENLDEADKMLSMNLTEEAMAVYQHALKEVDKKNNLDIYCRILLNLAMCYFNKSDYQDQEKNLSIAKIKFEEALHLIDPVHQKKEYLEALEQLSQIHINLSFIRSKLNNLRKAVGYSEKIIHYEKAIDYPETLSLAHFRIANCFEDIMRSDTNPDYLDKIKENYQIALKIIHPEQHRIKYYNILSAFGGSFINSQVFFPDKNKKIELLDEGIDLCKKALEIISPDEDLLNYSSTLSHMSHGYSYRGKMLNSIEDYTKALDFSKREIAILQNFKNHSHYLTGLSNQCIILQALFNITSLKEYLEESKKNCEIALGRITMESHPHRFGRFHANIGLNYIAELKLYPDQSDKRADLLKKALEEFNVASTILTKSQFLYDFKWLNQYRAKCYFQLGEIENKSLNWKFASELVNELLSCYHEDTPKDSVYQIVIELKQKMTENA